MFTKCYEEMINNYKNLYETKEGYDVKLYAGENNNNIKEFHVRSLILKTHSKFFKEIFSNDDIKKKDGYFIINSNNSPKVFDVLISYMYSGNIDLTSLQSREIFNLLLPLDKLGTSIFEIILKRNDFCIDNEIIIWENLLDWACEQLPPIQKDVDKWNKNDFILMKKRLSRFIPLIRFYHISSEDFLLKVYPFKELLSNDLINNVFTYYLSPNNINNIQLSRYSCSNIIESQHLIIISNWIDKKKYLHYNNKVDNIFHRFKLIYRSSRDGNGNTIKSFHENCDNKLNTILIAKIKNSEQIIGGYNPLTWDSSNSYKSTKDSFIFSFESKTIFQSAKVGYSNGDQPIYCGLKHGPTFGHDLDCFNNRWGSNRRFSYPKVGTVYQ
ncbi:BTB/POZ domain-containing protein [Rhizophagus clarus]|uniref:BTB/POZ domain-containing protein n=1 Tax=Rhizophagus clarus TaxID=94130 RepID=A0A8H3QM90_9GLOM|nr:BTB/POZ domain-containing protein [Rhizophagus clarus]